MESVRNFMISRRNAREAVIGLVFETEFNKEGFDPAELLEVAIEERELPADDYVKTCFFGICGKLTDIDAEIEKHSSGWKVERISKVSLSILRLAVYELLFAENKLPYSIAINEAVELAKLYAEDGAASFVNGILNALAKANNCEA